MHACQSTAYPSAQSPIPPPLSTSRCISINEDKLIVRHATHFVGLQLLGFVLFAASCPAAPQLAYNTARGGGVNGPSICVDPAFPYYKKQPWPTTFAQIRGAGFTAVQVVDVGTTTVSSDDLRRIADQCKAAGLAPVLRIYPPTHFRLYYEHPEWRQRMLGGADGCFDWRVYLCMNQPQFLKEYTRDLQDRLHGGPWAGVQFAELWLEQWGGPVEDGRPRAAYACVCEQCSNRFRHISGGIDAREMLTSTTSPHYFVHPQNTRLYKQWLDFRAETVTSFGASLAHAIRDVNTTIAIDVMSLSDALVEPGKAREYQAIDLDALVLALHPNSVTIEDAWQDWTRLDLSPDYVRAYGKAYVSRLHQLKPDIILFSHSDIGSIPTSRRSPAWIKSFAEESRKAGFDAPSFYEWSVSRLAR